MGLFCRAELAHEESRRRHAHLELGALGHRHEGGRAVLRVDERREEGMALAQAEEVERPLGAERVHGARRAALLAELAVAAGEAAELVRRTKAEHVGERPPLEE